MDFEAANQTAVQKMMAARPILKGVARARDVIPGLRENLLLHAGPPIEWERMSGPMRGAVIGALLLEGLANDEKQALGMVEAGEVEFAPCHHHQCVGPMAGVTSSSMMVYELENVTHGNKAYSNLNEGYGKVLRYGAYAPEVLEKLRWMNETMGPLLAEALAQSEGIDIRALVAEALHMGDEGHNRNKAGSLLFTRHLAPLIARVAENSADEAEILEFLGSNALSVLNPVMAACKAMADAAHNIEGASVVTAMGFSCREFAIRVSGLGDQWFTGPHAHVEAKLFEGHSEDEITWMGGESPIAETIGLGGFAQAAAFPLQRYQGGSAEAMVKRNLELYQITAGENTHYQIPFLGYRGSPTGIDIFKVLETGILPVMDIGVAGRDGGQIGAGIVRAPMTCFEAAAAAWRERYGPP